MIPWPCCSGTGTCTACAQTTCWMTLCQQCMLPVCITRCHEQNDHFTRLHPLAHTVSNSNASRVQARRFLLNWKSSKSSVFKTKVLEESAAPIFLSLSSQAHCPLLWIYWYPLHWLACHGEDAICASLLGSFACVAFTCVDFTCNESASGTESMCYFHLRVLNQPGLQVLLEPTLRVESTIRCRV